VGQIFFTQTAYPIIAGAFTKCKIRRVVLFASPVATARPTQRGAATFVQFFATRSLPPRFAHASSFGTAQSPFGVVRLHNGTSTMVGTIAGANIDLARGSSPSNVAHARTFHALAVGTTFVPRLTTSRRATAITATEARLATAKIRVSIDARQRTVPLAGIAQCPIVVATFLFDGVEVAQSNFMGGVRGFGFGHKSRVAFVGGKQIMAPLRRVMHRSQIGAVGGVFAHGVQGFVFVLIFQHVLRENTFAKIHFGVAVVGAIFLETKFTPPTSTALAFHDVQRRIEHTFASVVVGVAGTRTLRHTTMFTAPKRTVLVAHAQSMAVASAVVVTGGFGGTFFATGFASFFLFLFGWFWHFHF
jgi:hypothetical protein